ncbi:hypothetical protein ACH4EC_39505 [Streptomyces anulatus]
MHREPVLGGLIRAAHSVWRQGADGVDLLPAEVTAFIVEASWQPEDALDEVRRPSLRRRIGQQRPHELPLGI